MNREFVVDRSTLLTGAALKNFIAAGYSPVLYDPQTGLSCIIGQYLQATGVALRHLANKLSPASLTCVLPSDASWVQDRPNSSSQAACEIAEANDDPKLHQIRREQKLAKLMAKQGVEVVFVGRYADATRRVKAAFQN